NLMIAKWLPARFASGGSTTRRTAPGLGPSAPYSLGEKGASFGSYPYKGGALKTVKTNRRARYLRNASSLRNLCGGRFYRFLSRCWLRLGRGSTPWPGRPASRLILARYVPENCSSPSTDRVTMDTIMWLPLSSAERWPLWWRNRARVNFRTCCGAPALLWTT